MKHTPGKWTIHWNGKSSAEVHGPRYEIALLNGYVSEEELEANVQLIAAAPALLEALQFAKALLEASILWTSYADERISPAIAQAVAQEDNT